METQVNMTDHDLLIEIKTTLGFLMTSMKNMEDKLTAKADQAALKLVEDRLRSIEVKFWVGTGILFVGEIVFAAMVKSWFH